MSKRAANSESVEVNGMRAYTRSQDLLVCALHQPGSQCHRRQMLLFAGLRGTSSDRWAWDLSSRGPSPPSPPHALTPLPFEPGALNYTAGSLCFFSDKFLGWPPSFSSFVHPSQDRRNGLRRSWSLESIGNAVLRRASADRRPHRTSHLVRIGLRFRYQDTLFLAKVWEGQCSLAGKVCRRTAVPHAYRCFGAAAACPGKRRCSLLYLRRVDSSRVL